MKKLPQTGRMRCECEDEITDISAEKFVRAIAKRIIKMQRLYSNKRKGKRNQKIADG